MHAENVTDKYLATAAILDIDNDNIVNFRYR